MPIIWPSDEPQEESPQPRGSRYEVEVELLVNGVLFARSNQDVAQFKIAATIGNMVLDRMPLHDGAEITIKVRKIT